MVDPALVYVGGVVVLFFFWMYGIVAFLRDVKNRLVPAYRQWRRDDPDRQPPDEQSQMDGDRSRESTRPPGHARE